MRFQFCFSMQFNLSWLDKNAVAILMRFVPALTLMLLHCLLERVWLLLRRELLL